MITPRQNRFYWTLWEQAKGVLLNGRETLIGDEENKRRHELHVRAIGRDKSHYDLTNFEFDRVIAEMRAVIDPSDLNAQLRQEDMHATRLRYGLRSLMRELHIGEPYVDAIVRRMNSNGELGNNRVDALGVEDLRKVMIALRKHQHRGRVVREYVLHTT